MNTTDRSHRLDVAFNELLPPEFTWTECCDAAWLADFPCGVQPQFTFTTVMTICRQRILEGGAHLRDEDFELYLDDLSVWFFAPAASFILDEPTAGVMEIFQLTEPDTYTRLTDLAGRRGLDLFRFLGVDRRPT